MNTSQKIILAISFFLGLFFAGQIFGQQFATGWVPNPAETERFVKTIPAVYGDQVKNLVVGDNNADALLYRALVPCLEQEKQTDRIKIRGEWKCVTAYNQGSVGSCVGHGTASALSVLNAVEVWYRREAQRFRAMHSADGMYGLAREAAGMLRGGDGCTGSGAAKAVTQYGTLYNIKYDAADLTIDQPARCRQYGTQGVGSSLKSEATKRKILSTYRVSSGQEAWSLIGNGYPINVCSNQGFSKQRDKDGACQPSGNWSHSMSIIARRTTSSGRKLFLIWNSWGDNWCGGPYWQDMPFGSFWADFDVVGRMMSRGDSFAYSELDGFPARSLPDFGSKYYLGKLKIERKVNHEVSGCSRCIQHDRCNDVRGEHGTAKNNANRLRSSDLFGGRSGNGAGDDRVDLFRTGSRLHSP